jgi:hypothetical protein
MSKIFPSSLTASGEDVSSSSTPNFTPEQTDLSEWEEEQPLLKAFIEQKPLLKAFISRVERDAYKRVIDKIQMPTGEGQITWDVAYEELEKQKRRLTKKFLL